MITDSEIEQYLTELEQNPEHSLELEEEFQEYLQVEILPNLSNEEKSTLNFCLSVILYSCSKHFDNLEFELDDYLDTEDQNWSLRDKNKSLEESLNLFFQDYEQEDLLAFVEDMLVEDEDQELSIAGKEIIFICCKSFIDSISSINT